MKKTLLFTLLTSASIHAMESNVEIVPCDREKHEEQTFALLKETFKAPEVTDGDIISVLVKNNRATRRTPAETILGCITYYNSPPYRVFAPKITTIKYLVVAKEHRGKGYGKQLLRHVEDYARKNNMDKIAGVSNISAIGFYRKLGARQDEDDPSMLSINVSQPHNPPHMRSAYIAPLITIGIPITAYIFFTFLPSSKEND